jgi:hypothetical protein
MQSIFFFSIKVDWAPQLPISIENAPTEAKCCIVMEVNISNDVEDVEYSTVYVCS